MQQKTIKFMGAESQDIDINSYFYKNDLKDFIIERHNIDGKIINA